MAYGMLTSLPAIYGLYTSLVPVLVYFFMGSSRYLNIGNWFNYKHQNVDCAQKEDIFMKEIY